MAQNYPQFAGALLLLLMLLLTAGCATRKISVDTPEHAAAASKSLSQSPPPEAAKPAPEPTAAASTAQPAEAEQKTAVKSTDERTEQPASATNASTDGNAPSAREQLAVLRVQAGALITEVNGDPKLHCTRPDCTIPLTPGTHRLTVSYKDTTRRGGSTVTYASMYPRVIEVTLKPGHRYSVTASGRHSEKWWIAIEDQTANKMVYDDREKSD